MTRHPKRGRGGLLLAALMLGGICLPILPPPAAAVTFIEQAERLQHIYAFLLDFRPGGPPRVPEQSGVELGVEIIPRPDVDNRVGGKSEPIDAPPAIPRARLRLLSETGWVVGATYNPDTEFEGYRAPWLGAELGYRFLVGSLHAALRLYTIAAEVEGPITDKQTDDRFEMVNRGGDIRLGLPLGAAMIYGGTGRGRSESTLKVKSDGAQISAEINYSYWMAGISGDSGPWRFTLEQHRTEDFLDHIILAASILF